MKFHVLLAVVGITYAATAAVSPAPPAAGAVVRGTVTAVNGSTITLLRAIQIDVTSARLARGKQNAGSDALAVGARLTARITGQKSGKPGVLLADAVTIEPVDGTLTGSIESISPTAITLYGQVAALSSTTRFGGYLGSRQVRTASDLRAGDPVRVEVEAGTSLKAVEVIALGPAPRAAAVPAPNVATIVGAVGAIDKSVWTVGSTKVYVNSKTKISGDPHVGDSVSAFGIKTNDGALIASTITRK